jgi:Ca2+-binding RTX toxin-like protein
MTRKLLVALAAATGATLLSVPSASAFTTTPVWQCRGSATYTSVSGQNRVEPLVANGNINTVGGASEDRAQCVDSETGAGNTATQLGISPNFVTAVTGKAATSINPDLGRAIDQVASSEGRVENLGLLLAAGAPTIGIGAANSTASGRCASGNLNPVLTGNSDVADITLGGTKIPLDQLATQLTNILNPLIGALVEIKVDEQIRTTNSLTINAIHIKVIRGTTPLADIVVGQAKVGGNGPVCDPDKQGDGGGGGGNVCPAGSILDVSANVCVIRGSTSGSSLGDIIVGRPFQGPSGGTVVPIDIARKKYGRSPCLGFSGNPKFAIVGTNKADRITGTNIADRIIGLGGNDKLDGGRGNDCIEGRTGGDNISGALGNDKLYGSTGNDHLNGGPGTDYESAGAGNDTINAAFGRDRALGGSGRDFINIATAGPAASANCGSGGGDVARINNNERKRVRGCERVAVFTGNER